MPSFLRDRSRGALVVAGQHDDLDAERVQRADGFRRGCLDRIGDGEDARSLAVDGDEHRRSALALATSSAARSSALDAGDAAACRNAGLPTSTARPSTVAAHAAAGDRFEIRDASRASTPRSSRRATIAAASGCSLVRSTRRGERSSSFSRRTRWRAISGQPRFAFGERAGLVDDERRRPFPSARSPRRS